MLGVDITEFASVVKASTVAMMDPRNSKRREVLLASPPNLTEAEIKLCYSILGDTVKSAYMQAFLGEVRERFDDKKEVPGCLRAFGGDDAEELSHGADGHVYKLPDGTVAKLGVIHQHDDIPNPHMEHAKLEIRLATIAGKLGISPIVRDSFFCCSSMSCYYVIIMEPVDGPVLYKWLKKASQTNKDAMYKKIGTLLDKLHQVGIVHNDLHQGNIMIGRGGDPMIIDFSRSMYWKDEHRKDDAQLRSHFHNTLNHTDSLVDFVIMDLFEMGHFSKSVQNKLRV